MHVLGAGSIGLLVAFHLRHAGVPVTLLARSPLAANCMQADSAGGGLLTLEYAGMTDAGSGCLPLWQHQHERHSSAEGASTSEVPLQHAYPVSVDHATSAHDGGQISHLIVATKAVDTGVCSVERLFDLMLTLAVLVVNE